VLTGALKELVLADPSMREKFDEIILAAPDIGAETFRCDLAPKLAAAGSRVTLYASSGDDALRVADRVRAYPRAGDSGAALVMAPGVQTIDASAVDTSFIGAPQEALERSALADIGQLLAGQQPPAERPGLRAVDVPDGRYWTFNG
jgi:esterase/lipase superfamily enzyme